MATKTLTFADLPVGATFRLNDEDDKAEGAVLLRKASDEGYVDATNRGIHGDCDADYPVVLA